MSWKIVILIIILIIQSMIRVFAQHEISGTVSEKNGVPVPGANIFIEGTFDGCSSDSLGKFLFITDADSIRNLIVRYIGFREYRQELDLSRNHSGLEIIIKESSNQLDAVVISAGSFEAGDRKKGVVLKPLDIVTTAGGLGDIYGAMRTLPGAQTVGEDGRLFVRGGDASESRTFIDGMAVERPYYSTMPDIPTRGRFSPFMFSGTLFSSGGYSAEYGQALSSALILNTNDMPERSLASISLMTVGLGGSYTKRWKNTSLSFMANYTNLLPYYLAVPQYTDWETPPTGLDGMLSFQQKTGKDGLLKCFLSYDQGNSSMRYPRPVNVNEEMLLNLNDRNTYFNASYRDVLSEKFNLKAGLSYSYDKNDMDLGDDRLIEKVRVYQGRYTISWIQSEVFSLRFGNEYWHKQYDQDYYSSVEDTDYKSDFDDDFITAFAEGDISVGPKLALRVGGRLEYSELLGKVNAAPRASLAFKTTQHSQVSVAYGRFYQSPGDEYLRFNNGLDYENATHYIANFQYMKDDRIFRVEAYYKDYGRLVKFDSLHSPIPSSYSNDGRGYARGIDIFWRDNKSITFLEYWISYSYIDTQRDYLNYPNMATPTFVSNHTVSAVVKYFVPKINTQFGGTYTFATGRTYYNPNSVGFLTERAGNYNNLSLNISYLTHLWNQFTIVYFSVSNVLGAENIFGYNYSLYPNSNGVYDAVAVEPGARRFWFLGIFISLNVKQ
jgi:hypothetical protein